MVYWYQIQMATNTRDPGDAGADAGLAERLLAIGQDCAPRLQEPFRSADHGDLLYDENGWIHPILWQSSSFRWNSRV